MRIVTEDVWTAVHERPGGVPTGSTLRGTKGQLWGRPARGVESKYLLPGLARCGTCNGSMYVKSRSHGKRRAYFYGCTSFHLRGSSVCANSLEVPMERSDLAVLASIERDVLQPDVIAATLRKALERLKPQAAGRSGCPAGHREAAGDLGPPDGCRDCWRRAEHAGYGDQGTGVVAGSTARRTAVD